MKKLSDFLEARMVATGDYRVSASGRKIRRLIKIGDDDYDKEKDIDKDGDIDKNDVKEGAVPAHMKGKQKPYVSSDGKGNYEVLGNTGQTKAEFSRKEHGKDAHKKAQDHLKSKYDEYMKEETVLEGRSDAVIQTTASDADENARHIFNLRDHGIYAQQGAGASHHVLVPKEHEDKAREILAGHLKEATEQLAELSPGALKAYIKSAKSNKKFEADTQNTAMRKNDHMMASDSAEKVAKRKDGIKTAKAKLNKESTDPTPVAPAPYIHRVAVTVSDPDSSAVSKRDVKVQKMIRVTHHTDDKAVAVERAKKHYKKFGWKVHGAEHTGMVHEETINEYSMDDVRKDAADRLKKSIDKQSDDRIAALKNPPKKKGFFARVGEKQINMVKGAYHGLTKEETELEEAKVDKTDARFIQLARLGLVEQNDLANLRLAMKTLSEDKQLSVLQRNLLLNVYESLISIVTGDDTIFSRMKIKVQESVDKGEYDYEGQMARTQLQTILRNSEDLIDMIDDEENMPEWVQSKITLAQDYITTVRDYLQSKEELGEAATDVPFDGPYTKVPDSVKDKSGATHTPQSRARHLARLAMKQMAKKSNKA